MRALDKIDNLEPVSIANFALAKLGRGDRLAVMLHHDAAGQKLLRAEKGLDGAGKGG